MINNNARKNKTKLRVVDSSSSDIEGVNKTSAASNELEHIKARLSQSQIIANYASWEWNLVTNEIIWSENLFNIFEYDPNKVNLSLKALFKRVHSDDLKSVFETIQHRGEADKPTELEFRIILPDESIRIIYCHSTLEGDPSTNRQAFLIGTIQDITERKCIENELSDMKMELEDRVSERTAKLEKEIHERKEIETELKHYEQIVSSTREFLSVVDKTYTYLSANQYYLDSFQITKDDIVDRTVADLHGKERFENIIKPNLDKALAGENVSLKHWIELPTGKRFVDGIYTPLIGVDDEIIGVVTSVRDITDENNYLTELHHSDELKGTILNIALDAIITINDKGEIQEFNPSAEKIFGYSFDEAKGKSISDLIVPSRLREQL